MSKKEYTSDGNQLNAVVNLLEANIINNRTYFIYTNMNRLEILKLLSCKNVSILRDLHEGKYEVAKFMEQSKKPYKDALIEHEKQFKGLKP